MPYMESGGTGVLSSKTISSVTPCHFSPGVPYIDGAKAQKGAPISSAISRT